MFEEEAETFVNSLSEEDSPQAEITSRRRYVNRFTIENSKKGHFHYRSDPLNILKHKLINQHPRTFSCHCHP